MAKNSISNLSTEEKKIYRMKKIDEVAGMFSSSNEGLTVKDVAVDLKLNSETARSYVKELFKRGLICVDGTDGKSRIYKWVNGEEKVTPKKEAEAFETEGKEFEPDSFIPASNFCKQGDVIYISSRSGEGAFFKYLIMTPWDRKATVIGVIDEDNPRFDANDPNLIFVGMDPEKNVNLYADVTNTCSRGYKQFGERCMHIESDKLEDIKKRLTRTLQLSISASDNDRSIKDTLAKFRKASDLQTKELAKTKEAVRNLKVDLENQKIAMSYKNDEISQLIEERDVLSNNVRELSAEKTAIKAKYDLLANKPSTMDTTSMDMKLTIAKLETLNECLKASNATLESIVLKLIDR